MLNSTADRLAAYTHDVYRLAIGRKLKESRITEMVDFYRNGHDIVGHIKSLGSVAIPLHARATSFAPTLQAHLLTSDCICLILGGNNKERSEAWISRRTWSSMYDDIGGDSEDVFSFGKSKVIEDIYGKAQFLFDKGHICLLPTHVVNSYKEVYGSPEWPPFDYEKSISKHPQDHKPKLQEQLSEIVLPLLVGARASDIFQLISDEWDAFGRCRRYLICGISEMRDAHRDGSLSQIDLRRIKSEIIDDGIMTLGEKLKTLKKKGVLDTINASLASAAVIWTNIQTTGHIDAIGSAIATSIVGATGYANIVQYRDASEELKKHPHYFLYRLSDLPHQFVAA